jgi:hypothetical protein
LKQYAIPPEGMWYEINNEFGDSGGVYVLKCINESNNLPITINRLLAHDEQGILYIGKANCFTDRVAELKKSISPDYSSGSHECGSRYKNNENIQKAFPYKNLHIELIGSENPRQTESELLQEYETTFGELPPLNRSS